MIEIMSDVWSLAFANAPARHHASGTILFDRGDRVRSVMLVRKGRVALRRILNDGTSVTLHVAGPGTPVAEASLFAERYHCEALCDGPTVVAVLDRSAMRAILAKRGLAIDALAATAHELQALRSRVEVMRLRRVSDRLTAYLELHGEPKPGEWVRVADWIGVTPPALYGELARRR